METLGKVRQFLKEVVGEIRSHSVATVLALTTVSGFIFLSSLYGPGMISYLTTAPAAAVVTVTALARLNDITPNRKQFVWQLRRLGLVVTGAAAITVLAGPLAVVPQYPTWVGSMLMWGLASSWITTPGMPPWWKYISTDEVPHNGRHKPSAD